jgi:hypothetical protein
MWAVCDRTESPSGTSSITRNTTRVGGDERTRTADPLLAKQVLYQLSYVPWFALDHTDSPEPMPQSTMSVPDRSRGPRARESAMTDYLLLYSGGSMPETEEEQKTVMESWNTWMGQLGSSLKDGGNPFTPASKTISADGSVGDGGGSASGYSILSADSLDAAAEMAKGCPVLQGGAQITVYETFSVM